MAAGPIQGISTWFANADHVAIRKFEDVYLVFNRLSGDTHILNFLSATILDTLCEQRVSVPDLAAAVRKKLSIDTEDCPDSLVNTTLLQLDDVGLVCPVQEQACA